MKVASRQRNRRNRKLARKRRSNPVQVKARDPRPDRFPVREGKHHRLPGAARGLKSDAERRLSGRGRHLVIVADLFNLAVYDLHHFRANRLDPSASRTGSREQGLSYPASVIAGAQT